MEAMEPPLPPPGVVHPETIPLGFELRPDEAAGAYFLFSPYTGETVFGATLTDPDYGVTRGRRRGTFWRQPERTLSEYRSLLARDKAAAKTNKKKRARKMSQEEATAVLLRLARRVLALRRVYHRIKEVYERCYDQQSGFFFYVHRETQATQWYKPIGLLSHRDIPMAGQEEEEEEGQEGASGGSLPAIKTDPMSFWGRTPQTRGYKRDRYMKGPIFRRTGFFRDVEICHINNLLVEKPFSTQKVHREYRDIDTTKVGLLDKVVWETKYERQEATRGSDVVLRVMRKYPQHRVVQAQGFMQLATFDYQGTRDGAASYKAVEVIKAVMEVLEANRDDEPVMLNALQALVVVSTHYQNRAVMMRKGMLEHVKQLFRKVKKDKIVMRIGTEDRKIETLSPYHISIAYYAVKLAGGLAYDDVHREQVATTCLAGLLHAMKVCADETHVLQEGLLALYNFVFLNEDCHMFLTDHKVLKTVKRLIDPFTHDKELTRLGRRCVAALSPGGWRAGLADA